jgi:transcriptional regulator with XRE-family HTH domain
VTFNSKVLRDLLKARSLTQASLSERLGMEFESLREELRREPEPKQGILQAIAKDLAVPPFVFYMKEAPPLHDILPDFRSETPGPSPKSRDTIEAVQLAEGLHLCCLLLQMCLLVK